ncbi:hypothetical protein SeMB42_g01577 [Synchytrium endobioticum]|uniref:NADH:ubiquinone reductase (non-electrogenic) n=1 Tax=Synchytrium endobioticum TaxID=286115 RepID=A0A507DD20_9FUNG|nr:hypothetical protein SeLEV6574_g01462 [Synchytrium endobioticum]TPX52240.1 hypothetical protein SeMB42_g01577 [Synchytrium endobioticum]
MNIARVARVASLVARSSTLPANIVRIRYASSAADPPKTRGWRRILRPLLGAAAVAGVTSIAFAIWTARHPPPQMEYDPSKKTLAILGTGWGATSLLKQLDNEEFNVVVISPRNYFLFTPLLPSCTVGTVELRSIMTPVRHFTRFKRRSVRFVEGECTDIDPENKVLVVEDLSPVKGEVSRQKVPYDYLVVAVGAENATFGIPGVKEHACFLKETWDARKIRTRLMDAIESAAFPGQPSDEVDRLLHMVVVGGGPSGVEYAAELHDFLVDDLVDWFPEIAGRIKITLVEAMQHVLPMFSKQLIDYAEKTFAEEKVNIKNNTMVKEVHPKHLVVQDAKTKEISNINYGLLVWATGNAPRPLISNLIKKLPSDLQNQRRGLVVDEFLRVKGARDMFCLGDASASKYAATAQVASRQGEYLAYVFKQMAGQEKEQADLAAAGSLAQAAKVPLALEPFENVSLGTLAYIGSNHAIADLPFGISLGGVLTFYFWRSAYMSNLFSWRNRALVAFDWTKATIFGRDVSRE